MKYIDYTDKDISKEEKWKLDKLGMISASRINELMGEARGKNKEFFESAKCQNLIHELATELATGESANKDISNVSYIKNGKEFEATALKNLQLYLGKDFVCQGLFNVFLRPKDPKLNKICGASLDVIIKDNNDNNLGLAEIKVRSSCGKQTETVLLSSGKEIEDKYYYQMQMQMLVTDMDKGIFFSTYYGEPYSKDIPDISPYCRHKAIIVDRCEETTAKIRDRILTVYPIIIEKAEKIKKDIEEGHSQRKEIIKYLKK